MTIRSRNDKAPNVVPFKQPNGTVAQDLAGRMGDDETLVRHIGHLDPNLIFSSEHPPKPFAFARWDPAHLKKDKVAAYYDEQHDDFFVFVFQILELGDPAARHLNQSLIVEISKIAELYEFDGRRMNRAHLGADDEPLTVRFVFSGSELGGGRSVEIDLDRLLARFPHRAERIADMINFLGDALSTVTKQ